MFGQWSALSAPVHPHFNTVYYSVHMLKVVLHLPLCACAWSLLACACLVRTVPHVPHAKDISCLTGNLPAQQSFGHVCESSVNSPKHGVICALATLQTTSDHTVLQRFKVAERCRNVA